MKEETVISHRPLRDFVKKVFIAAGCSIPDANIAADALTDADLRGIDSHGVARLSGYIRLFKAGRINPLPSIEIIRSKGGNFTINGDGGLGLVVAAKAMDMVLERVEHFGSSWCSVMNSNHFGIAAFHAMKALDRNAIGFSMTNASPLVAPTFAKERMLGTNPICVAIPAGKNRPFVLDMATSAAANGKLEIAERKGASIPEGWLMTKEGNTSISPSELRNGGFLLPLGSDRDHGSHKGFGLSSWVDIFAGVLSGANFGPWVPPFVSFLDVASDLPGKGLGHFLGAWSIDGFMDIETFKNRMDLWINRFRETQPLKNEQRVIIPGEPEFDAQAQRLLNGIPLTQPVVADLINLAQQLQLDHPFEN